MSQRTICVHKREPSQSEPLEMVVILDQTEVERAWAGYVQSSPFVLVNPDPGDEELPPINPKGFAKYLSAGYGCRGFEVEFKGDEVHVTPPMLRRSPVTIGISVRQVSG